MSSRFTPSAQKLLARYRATGSPEALGAFFDATAPVVFRVAMTICRDAHLAEDALQETFLAALEDVETFDPTRRVMPWLMGILRNRVLRQRRQAARRPDPVRLAARHDGPTPSGRVAAREELRVARHEIDALPEPLHSVALLHFAYGLSPAEIAHVRDEPPGTTRSHLSRARQRLRRAVPVAVGGFELKPLYGLEGVRAVVTETARTRASLLAGGAAVGLGGGVLMSKKVAAFGVLLLCLLGGTLGTLALWPPDADRSSDAEPSLEGERAVAQQPPTLDAQRSGHGSDGGLRSGAVVLAPHDITGVVCTASGEGIAGARVVLLPKDAESRTATTSEATTGEAGRFVLRPGVRGACGSLTASATGYTSETLVDVQSGTEVCIRLWKGARLEGRILDARSGEPVAGAVIAARSGDGRLHPTLFEDVRTRSREDGTYVLDGVPPGTALVAVRGPAHALRRLSLVVKAGGHLERDIHLNRGCRLTGRVTAAGVPLAGIQVRADGDQGYELPFELSRRVARTDAKGRYEIEGLVPAKWYVSVHDAKAGYGVNTVRVDRGQSHASLDVAVSGSTVVTGRVLRAGKPVAGARVGTTLQEWERMGVVTGPDGAFEVRESLILQKGRLDVLLPGVGGAQLVMPPQALADTAHEIEIVPFARVSGQVRADEGTVPPGTRLRQEWGDDLWVPNEARVSRDGRFELLAVGSGSVTLQAEAPGRARTTRVELSLLAGKTAPDVELVFRAGHALRGRVVDQDGRPSHAWRS